MRLFEAIPDKKLLHRYQIAFFIDGGVNDWSHSFDLGNKDRNLHINPVFPNADSDDVMRVFFHPDGVVFTVKFLMQA